MNSFFLTNFTRETWHSGAAEPAAPESCCFHSFSGGYTSRPRLASSAFRQSNRVFLFLYFFHLLLNQKVILSPAIPSHVSICPILHPLSALPPCLCFWWCVCPPLCFVHGLITPLSHLSIHPLAPLPLPDRVQGLSILPLTAVLNWRRKRRRRRKKKADRPSSPWRFPPGSLRGGVVVLLWCSRHHPEVWSWEKCLLAPFCLASLAEIGKVVVIGSNPCKPITTVTEHQKANHPLFKWWKWHKVIYFSLAFCLQFKGWGELHAVFGTTGSYPNTSMVIG